MKKPFTLILVLIAAIIIILGMYHISFPKPDTYQIHVYPGKTGFGYEITAQGKILIKQDYIPAIQNEIEFCSAKDAQKIASIVVYKLEKNTFPRITLKELQENEISLNCLN